MCRKLIFFALLLTLILPGIAAARWIDDIATINVGATGPVKFSHYNHLDALGKKCTLCHNKIFNIVVSKNPKFTMDDMRKGKACGACHNGNKAFAVDDDCSACHPTHDVAFKNDSAPALFPHGPHTEMYGCSDCHTGIFVPDYKKSKRHTMAQMAEGESCGACHDGDTAFSVKDQENCTKCHPTHDVKFKTDAGDATFPHSVHTGMYGCSDCHSGIFIPDFKKSKRYTMDQMAKGESCGACHDGNTAFSVEGDCETCHEM